MKGRKIGEIGVSSRGLYMRNIADIIPNGGDICIGDIPELYAIPSHAFIPNKNHFSTLTT